ncbi:MAG: DUF1206 domain-containing protein [Anaerolineae bacterium]|nr:DUF1206 domain-containing protein [Phycisphaerae bacterium]
MTNLTLPTQREVTDHVRRAVRRASPFVEKFARVGYAAKGAIYSLAGLLALMAALGQRGGETSGARGVMQRLFDQPFGLFLLGALAAGLACYAVWQFIRVVEDPERVGNDANRLMKRIGYFGSGIIHSALVVSAINLLLGYARHGDDNASARGWSATLMSYPAGRWLVAAIGIGIGVYGLKQIYNGFTAKLDRIDVSPLPRAARRWVCRACQFGLAARGLVFAIIGTFFALTAYHKRPSEAKGLSGALDTVREQAYGPWLLAIAALGLIAYGFYEFVKAMYRRITVS